MKFEVRSGTFSFKGVAPILQNINFSIESRCVLSILGPNGVGKTTLLRCMMGMLPWQSGGSYVDSQNIAEISERELWRQIAYVPQAKYMPFAFTVEEMILLGRSVHTGLFGTPGEKDRQFCEEAMAAVGITHLRTKHCNRLSGGELQMVLIARALCSRPKMLVLDEPESNLDFRNQLIILETVRRLSKEDGLCCVFNTHYPAHALRISDRSLVLSRDGESLFGPSDEVITSKTMEDIFRVHVDILQASYLGVNYHAVTAVSLL
ncbi:ABC transporter ATP-binding protein [Treponema parvum]|uniref:ABC transporter ATP-binding protein n=1 Tax=Treponema parvum TaxID=138851 RepID=UPI001AEBA866|nr:ABC transporter ATP-binding protein [Treponema parvum]QTQ15414.1 ABC transporter ATP-binding protein [Treponema parvum]